MKRILIVEDDGAIAAIERDYLMLSDFQVDIAATGPEGLAMAWGMVVLTGEQKALPQVDRRSGTFLVLSGLATGASWLCYYRALQSGPASVVVPIDKLSILVTVAFSRLVFQERLTSRSAAGLALIVAGTLAMLF